MPRLALLGVPSRVLSTLLVGVLLADTLSECNPGEATRQAEARMAVFEFIEGFYNPHRRYSAIG